MKRWATGAPTTASTSVQKPEKLYREKGLLMYMIILAAVFILALFIKIPALEVFLDSKIIGL